MQLPYAADFFAYARERHSVHLRRLAGEPAPWTDDPILRKYRFTQVFRELDRTTIWFRQFVREPLREKPEVLLATVLFRWFNRISTGEGIFLQQDVERGSAFDVYLRTGNRRVLEQACVAINGARGPHVTGAYIVLGKRGMPKMQGVVAAFHDFAQNYNWRDTARECLACRDIPGRELNLEHIWRWLRDVPYLGPFMAYEIVTDLRWTALLDRAPDINTWANPGPGALRGAARVLGVSERRYRRDDPSTKPFVTKASVAETHDVMRELLFRSRLSEFWPQGWPEWEMRDVEHTLCEFDKYERARLGQGRPRGVFRA